MFKTILINCIFTLPERTRMNIIGFVQYRNGCIAFLNIFDGNKLFVWCFTALRHFSCHFGRGQLKTTYPHYSWASS